MTQQQIQQLFQQRYNQNNWKQFLGQAFANARLLSTPETLTGINADVATNAVRLGYIKINEDGIERNIAVYDVTLAKGIVLERNRVGLRNLLRKYWKDIDAAFIVYHRPVTSTSSVSNWRFTYVSELTGFDAEGELIKIKTEPKRYTYILGEGESCRTAAERFAIIAKKGSSATLDDVKDAFSVEKLSKAFFEQYKEHYENFVEFLTGKRLVKSGSKWKEKQTGKPNPQLAYLFNGDEKEARDFNKKLLGRIVFLYFIQKKGWMGVPEKSNWGQGDPNFLWNLYDHCSNKGIFYSEYLSKLFFDTLNTQRKDDLIELIPGEKIRIPFLNGGLFEEDNKKYRNLIFPAELFENLFQFFNQYNFTIYEDDPNDHTVAVDPEMLGHIFENLLEDNKDKGAYYTPKEIVHYMCQESLIEYLTTWFQNKGYEVTGYIGLDKPDQPQIFSPNEGRKGQAILEIPVQKKSNQIDRLLIEKLLKKKLDNSDKELILKHSDEFHTALDNVKICDPAIGSGAFPMGLLKEIFTAKQTLYTFKHGNTEGFDASGVKLNIIQKSIYGVDIEKGAVDIARLRFWLSLVVDEDEPKALPNLDYKIVVGNSLVSKLGDDVIDIDWDLKEGTQSNLFGQELEKQKSELLKKISREQKDFFNPDSDKKKLAADIRNLKIDLLINQLDLMVKTQGVENQPSGHGKTIAKQTERFLQTLGWKRQIEKLKKLKSKPDEPLHFFDWKLDFPEVMNEQVTDNVGFDIVIGNPPYVRADNPEFAELREQIMSLGTYETLWEKWDLMVAFVEKGLKLLSISGNFSFIVSNSITTSKFAYKLQDWIIENFHLKSIDYFENIKVFDAGVIPVILSVTTNKQNTETIKNIRNGSFENKEVKRIQTANVNDEFARAILFKKYYNETFIPTINTIRLGDICYLSYGLRPNSDERFWKGEFSKDDVISDIKTEVYSKEYVEGKDIKEYEIEKIKYLEWNTERIPKKLVRPTFPDLYVGKKILRGRVTKGTFDDTGIVCNDSIIVMKRFIDLKGVNERSITSSISKNNLDKADKEKSGSAKKSALHKRRRELENSSSNYFLKYILAVINSKYAMAYLNNYRRHRLENYFYPDDFRNYPIPVIEIEKQKQFVGIVDKVLSLKSQGKDTNVLEQQIDNMVYKLYGLTYEEVKVIDPEFGLSEQEYEKIKV